MHNFGVALFVNGKLSCHLLRVSVWRKVNVEMPVCLFATNSLRSMFRYVNQTLACLNTEFYVTVTNQFTQHVKLNHTTDKEV